MGNRSSKQAQEDPPASTQQRRPRRLSKPPTNGTTSSIVRSSAKANKIGETEAFHPLVILQTQRTGDLPLESSTVSIKSEESQLHSSASSLSVPRTGSTLTGHKGHRWTNCHGSQLRATQSSISTLDAPITRSSQDSKPRARQSLQQNPLPRVAPTYLHSRRLIDKRDCDVTDKAPAPMEKSPYSSLIRRRSLGTPGIATRNPDHPWKKPATVEEECVSFHSYTSLPSRYSQWPLLNPGSTGLAAPPNFANLHRTESPVALDYSHLGGLKAGSLHIVNGAISPEPSDRSSRSFVSCSPPPEPRISERGSSSPCHLKPRVGKNIRRIEHALEEQRMPHGSEQNEQRVNSCIGESTSPAETLNHRPREAVENRKRTTRLVTSPQLLPQNTPSAQLWSGQDSNKDVPESPFSFEPSPIVSFPPKELNDADIHISYDRTIDDRKSVGSRGSSEGDKRSSSSSSIFDMRNSQALSKADSGYSSVSSVYSMHREQGCYHDAIKSPPLPSPPPAPLDESELHLNTIIMNDRFPKHVLSQKSKDCLVFSPKEHILQKTMPPPQLSHSTGHCEPGELSTCGEKSGSSRRSPPETKVIIPRYYASLPAIRIDSGKPYTQQHEGAQSSQATALTIQRRPFTAVSQGDLRSRWNAVADRGNTHGGPPTPVVMYEDQSTWSYKRHEKVNNTDGCNRNQRVRAKSTPSPAPYTECRARSKPRLPCPSNCPSYGMKEDRYPTHAYAPQRGHYIPTVSTFPNARNTRQKDQGRFDCAERGNPIGSRSWTRSGEFSQHHTIIGGETSTQFLYKHDGIQAFSF